MATTHVGTYRGFTFALDGTRYLILLGTKYVISAKSLDEAKSLIDRFLS